MQFAWSLASMTDQDSYWELPFAAVAKNMYMCMNGMWNWVVQVLVPEINIKLLTVVWKSTKMWSLRPTHECNKSQENETFGLQMRCVTWEPDQLHCFGPKLKWVSQSCMKISFQCDSFWSPKTSEIRGRTYHDRQDTVLRCEQIDRWCSRSSPVQETKCRVTQCFVYMLRG